MPAPWRFFNRVLLEMARFEPSRRPVLMQDRTLCRSVQLGFGAGTVSSNGIGILNLAFFRVPTLRIPVADRVRVPPDPGMRLHGGAGPRLPRGGFDRTQKGTPEVSGRAEGRGRGGEYG